MLARPDNEARRLKQLLAAAVTLFFASPVSALDPTVEFGIGLPELTHLRAGVFVHPRVAVQGYVSTIVFNWMTGVSVTGYVLGTARPDGPPKHALLLQSTLAFNPLADPISISGGGETIGAGIILEGGYGLTTNSGFMFHATAGAILYIEGNRSALDGRPSTDPDRAPHLVAAPNFGISAGWKF